MQEKWTSVIFHIQTIHCWTGYRKFRNYSHAILTPEIQRSNEWLISDSEAFAVLQKVVLIRHL